MTHETDPSLGDHHPQHPLAADLESGRVPASQGDVSVYYQPTGIVVLLRGHIDIGQALELEAAGSYAVVQQTSITVDVRHIDVIDSVGISFLVRVAASMRSHGSTVTLCGPSPLVAGMLGVVGAISLFTWVDGRPGVDGVPTP